MKLCILTLLASSFLGATDPRMLELSLKAQSDFERVEMSPRPSIADAEACIQSEAAALSVSPPEEKSLLYYRKGYCTFADAFATRNSRQFQVAAGEFDKAIESWPLRVRKPSKLVKPEPVSPSLRVFAAIARLRGSTDPTTLQKVRQEIGIALEAPVCNSDVMAPAFCAEVLADGSQWMGWAALRDEQFDEAARRFAGSPASGWPAWVQGRRDFAAARYSAAATQYGQAVDQWRRIWQGAGPTFRQSLGPQPTLSTALADWGGARMLAGDLPGAIQTLDASLQTDSVNSHALFLRARAKELSGLRDAALADYGLASRAAFAAAEDLASGEAHLYRGIAHYRQNDFARAEEEFASALSFEMAAALRPDARAWRHLAAVAAGSCGESRQSLATALGTVSPFFPREEARSRTAACGTA